MLLPVYYFIADVVILDDILEAPIVSEQTKFDDMIAEFLPFHALIAIDIDLLEEVNKRKGKLEFEFGVITIIVEVFQHH
jgi:hypothetical protein